MRQSSEQLEGLEKEATGDETAGPESVVGCCEHGDEPLVPAPWT